MTSTRTATEKCMRNLDGLGLAIEPCRSPQQAVEGAQIITTVTADKQFATILTDNMVGPGVHINAVGGDCPGKTELHPDILRRSDIYRRISAADPHRRGDPAIAGGPPGDRSCGR